MGRDVAFPGFVDGEEIYDLLCPASPVRDPVDLIQNANTCIRGARE